jgi:hypothetical protein
LAGVAFAFALVVALHLGCAAQARAPTSKAQLDDVPMLRLTPASFGKTVSLTQHLSIEAGNKREQLEAYLEIDATSVKLAALALGQTAARLLWDGKSMETSRAAWLPSEVQPELVLNDLQLALWPAEAIRAALPSGWMLDVTPTSRQLKRGEAVVVDITFAGSARLELVHHRFGYRLRVETIVLDEGS